MAKSKLESPHAIDLVADNTVVTGDATIDTSLQGVRGTYLLTKGSAAAITLPLPIAGDPRFGGQDGTRLTFIAGSAQAHVVTQATDGFNAKGSSGTATFTAAIGNAFTVEAYNGHWYTVSLLNVTIA